MSDINSLLTLAESGYTAGPNELLIDVDARTIAVPTVEMILGVESDENAEIKHFLCPRFTCDGGLDLSTFFICVNYKNAAGEGGKYVVTDIAVDDAYIKFSWLISRHVAVRAGVVQFSICFTKRAETGEIEKEWNTTITKGTVLPGLEVD